MSVEIGGIVGLIVGISSLSLRAYVIHHLRILDFYSAGLSRNF